MIWMDLVSVNISKKDTDNGVKQRIVMKWKAVNDTHLELVMKFDSEIDAQEWFNAHGLNMALGERVQIDMQPPKRLNEYEER